MRATCMQNTVYMQMLTLVIDSACDQPPEMQMPQLTSLTTVKHDYLHYLK